MDSSNRNTKKDLIASLLSLDRKSSKTLNNIKTILI